MNTMSWNAVENSLKTIVLLVRTIAHERNRAAAQYALAEVQRELEVACELVASGKGDHARLLDLVVALKHEVNELKETPAVRQRVA